MPLFLDHFAPELSAFTAHGGGKVRLSAPGMPVVAGHFGIMGRLAL